MSVTKMSQRIEAEREGRKLGEIKELNLEGCLATEVEGLTNEYTCLEKLNMANVGLKTLAGLPALPALMHLDVSGNPITEGLEVLKSCPNLVSLNLSGNKLATIADLAPLASLENLSSLEMGDCDLVSVDGYRKEVFSILPNLKVLDGLDRDGVEELNERFTGGVANGPKNGHVITANDEGDEEEEEEEDDDEGQEEDEDEDDEEEDIGISALQGSKDLEDDEEDYVPGEGEDDAEDEEEDDDEGDEDEGEGENVEDEIANLSGSGVTDTRRAQKRPADDSDAVGVSEAKVAATEDN